MVSVASLERKYLSSLESTFLNCSREKSSGQSTTVFSRKYVAKIGGVTVLSEKKMIEFSVSGFFSGVDSVRRSYQYFSRRRVIGRVRKNQSTR